MKNTLRKMRARLSRNRREEGLSSFRALFEKFRELLDDNNRVLELMADMGDKLSGDFVFDSQYLETTVTELENLVHRIIFHLNAITGNRYPALIDAFERIRLEVRAELAQTGLPHRRDVVLPLAEANLDLVELVGGKIATLGEIQARLHQRVPEGFVITTNGYRRFIGQKGVADALSKALEDLDAGEDPATVSEHVREAMARAPVPEGVERRMLRAARKLEEDGHAYFSVRSSAVEEDAGLSFAGQYKSCLQVPVERLAARYKDVVASLFSTEAIHYRQEHGIRHQDSAMAVGILAMVAPKASGVMYTRDPEAAGEDVILISAAWGLARTVVDGRSPTDFYKVGRRGSPGRPLQEKIGRKEKQLVPDAAKGEREEDVPPELQNERCLSPRDLERMAEIAQRLESYFRCPQDIEWAIDAEGEPLVLQSRPLRVSSVEGVVPEKVFEACRAYPRLMEDAGMIACRGIGAGKVVQVLSDADFERFERGSVLVARSTSPRLSPLIPLSAAVVTDIGTPTGHMATVAREYRVPTLVDAAMATAKLREGMEVTVDAEERVIYQGIVQELLEFQTLIEQPFADAREFRMLRRLLKKVSPLYLTDPQGKEFSAENCRTYHDITRFCHETVVREFINFHLRGRRWKRIPLYRLSLPVPLNLMLIDIGEGIQPDATGHVLTPEKILSAPLKGLLQGLCEAGVWRTDPVDMDFRSFMSSFTRTSHMASMDPKEAQNLAVISRDYMNLNLRLGYHFNMIDTLMTENRNENYIYFRFLGGVTDLSRRSRRAKFLAEVLSQHDFVVEVKGDLVVGKIRKIHEAMMKRRLEMLGRLVGYARQLDVLMRTEETVGKYVREFLEPCDGADPIA